MNTKLMLKTARSVTFEILDGGRFFTKESYDVFFNGEKKLTTDKCINSVFGLMPETLYEVQIKKKENEAVEAAFSFETDYEFVTLNVRDFGAKGDGSQDDTTYIQAAILACPPKSRVLIPAGEYKITSLFLKSHVNVELAKGAELVADQNRWKYPIFPAVIPSYDETDEYNLGTWEGNPLPMFAGIITGLNVEDVTLYGEGTINGNATHDNWWKDVRTMKGAFRPRSLFISHCKDMRFQGLLIKNSPSWTIHPYFSNELKFYSTSVQNPAISPNTDGLDPESCKDVEIIGVHFSLGDDCIAVKSGKIYMGRKYKTPSENILIRQCLMENGHGAVTIGSEMAGGVKNLVVEDCIFRNTDRGLRIKTRRGRGKDAVVDGITFKNIDMDHVMTPLVANSFYFCDPDGHMEYVQSREVYPVDERTPEIKKLTFENLKCTNCHVAAGYFEGLPEKKIEEISLKNVYIDFAEECKEDVPAMSEGVPKSTKRGMFVSNVEKLVLENVTVVGQTGEKLEVHGIDQITGQCN